MSVVVIDLGCKSYGGADDSLAPLIDRYRPALLLGFDPQLEREETRMTLGTMVMLSKKVGWTHGGKVRFAGNGLCAGVRGRIGVDEEWGDFPFFDVAELIRALPGNTLLIVKLDIEGAEYSLLAHLEERDAILPVAKFLVEWHTDDYLHGHVVRAGREYYEAKYPGRFEVWHDPLHRRCCRDLDRV